MLRNLEISIYRDSKKIYETTESKKINNKLVVCSNILPIVAAKTVISPNFNIFTPLAGFDPTLIIVIGAITLVTLAIIFTMKRSEGSILENLIYLIIALSPAIYLIFVCFGVF